MSSKQPEKFDSQKAMGLVSRSKIYGQSTRVLFNLLKKKKKIGNDDGSSEPVAIYFGTYI